MHMYITMHTTLQLLSFRCLGEHTVLHVHNHLHETVDLRKFCYTDLRQHTHYVKNQCDNYSKEQWIRIA